MANDNKNRPGYKETKVGWIPVRWGDTTLGKLGIILSGGTPSSTEDAFWNGAITWITPTDITKLKTRYISSSARTITDAGLKKSSAVMLPAGTLVLCTRATIGECAITESPATTNQGFKNLIPNSSANIDYIYYQIKNQTHALKRLGCGSTFLEVSKTDISKVHIPLPPLPEQRKIAEILSCWDEGLESLEKLIEAKKLRKKGLMQKLLTGEKRLPGFAGSKHRHSTALGEMPADWPLEKMSTVFKKVKRKNGSTNISVVLTASGEHGLVDQTSYFTKSVAGKDLSGYDLLKQGEFAYNRSAMNGYPYGAIKRLDRYEQGLLSTLYSCFALQSSEYVSDFYAYFFESGLLDRQLRSVTQVGGRAHGLLNITDSDFYKINIPIPPREEQRAIASILNTAAAEIRLLEAERDALAEQKKGLMQKLLTGEVRYPDFIGQDQQD